MFWPFIAASVVATAFTQLGIMSTKLSLIALAGKIAVGVILLIAVVLLLAHYRGKTPQQG